MSRRIADLLIKIGADSYEFKQKTDGVSKELSQLEKKMTSIGKTLSLKLTAPLAALGAVSLANADTQEKAEAKVQQALKTTGGAVKLNFEQLKAFASDLQGKTLFGDETILNDSTARLLAFTNIAGENFKRTQALALDLSTALEVDLGSATTMLAKAISDPETKLQSLSRAGVTFTKEQEEMIKTMAKTGDTAKAQTMILDELEKRFGGQAEAAAKVGLGAVQQLKNAWGDFAEQIGQTMMPIVNKLAAVLTKVVAALQKMTPATKTALVTVSALAAAIGPLSLTIGSIIKMLPTLAAGFTAMTGPIGLACAAVMALGAAFIYAKNRKEELLEEKVEQYENLSLGTLERNLKENRRQQAVAHNESPFQGGSLASKVNYALNQPNRIRELELEEKALTEAISRRKKAIEEAERAERERKAVEDQLAAAMGEVSVQTTVVADATEQQAGIIGKLTEKISELEKKKLLPESSLSDIARYNEEIARLKEELEGIQNLRPDDLKPRESISLEALPPIEAPALVVTPPDIKPVISQYQQQMSQIADIVRNGIFDWADTTSDHLKDNYSETVNAVKNYTDALVEKGYKFSDALETVAQTVKTTMDRFDQQVSTFLADSITAAAEAFGQMLAGELGFEGLMKAILLQFASFLKNIGAQLIEFGVMIVAFKSTLKSVLANPWAAIGVGAAMVAAAALMTALINKSAAESVPALASGGLAYGKTYAIVGDNPSAAVDPEVIAPLSKLQSMLPEGGAAGNINLNISGEMKASGRDLAYIFKKEDFKKTVLGAV